MCIRDRNEGLLLIRYPPEPIAIFLDALSALHEKVLDDYRRAKAKARAAERAQTLADDASDSTSALLEAADSESLQTDSGMVPLDFPDGSDTRDTYIPSDQSVGAEVELMLDGAWLRAKLTWIGRERKLFMFVSGAGLAHAMSRRTMDKLQSQGRIRVVRPVFDLLLESGLAPLADDPQSDR